jgi:DNA-binding XRE family transcriptional regulator
LLSKKLPAAPRQHRSINPSPPQSGPNSKVFDYIDPTGEGIVPPVRKMIKLAAEDRLNTMTEIRIDRAPDEGAVLRLARRTAAGLTQTQLAGLIDTTASVICRIENADYEGHSLAMLRRIAGALNQRVEIRFVPIRRSA